MRKHKKTLIISSLIFIIFISYIIIGFCDTKLELTKYTYHNTKLPADFDGYKIVQISDLHHKNFGKHQNDLINMIKDADPDMIILTGDIVDEDHSDMSSTEDFIEGISKIAPVYSVSGNHELDNKAARQYDALLTLFSKYDITDLDDDSVEITRGNSSIILSGQKCHLKYITKTLPYADESKFNILLYHCSNYFYLINEYGYDLVFSGHTHGGIIRLPFVGGLIDNGGDYFPKYDGGIYIENNSTLISSRGLGDADAPRFYNPPEVVCVTLHCN